MRIAYIQYTNPAGYPPLEHSSRILAAAGWQVLFLGTGAAGAGPLTFPPHPNITVKRLSYWPPGFRQKIHYLFYFAWVTAWVLFWRPRWIYASDVLTCPIAVALSLVPGLEIVYHEHDSPDIRGGANRPRRLARRLLARRAACSILPNSRRAERFSAEAGEAASPVVCVWNCPRRDEVSAPRESIQSPDTIWLLYHGSIVPSRLPLSVLSALAALPESVKLRIVGYETLGSLGYVGVIRDRAAKLRVLHRLHIVGPVPRHELLGHGLSSDIGLALIPKRFPDINMNAMTGASNKPFDYLACGLALVVSDLPDWTSLFVNPGYAVSCDPEEPASIERAIRSLIKDPAKMRGMGELGRQRIQREWNYETQFAPVFDRLTRRVGLSPKRDLVQA